MSIIIYKVGPKSDREIYGVKWVSPINDPISG